MSVRGTYAVWCNQQDCLARIGQEDTEAEARTLAERLGWLTGSPRNPFDLCAAHKPQPEPACGKDGARLRPDGSLWICTRCRSATPEPQGLQPLAGKENTTRGDR